MATEVRLDDRASIETLYPAEVFRQDASRNAIGNAAILHGLKILSQPDATGAFRLARAQQQTGERDPEGDAVFLPPYMADEGGTAEAAGPGDKGLPTDAYGAFIDAVIATARAVRFKTPDGQDPRLRGFHGG